MRLNIITILRKRDYPATGFWLATFCLLFMLIAPLLTKPVSQVEANEVEKASIEKYIHLLGSEEASEREDAVNNLTRYDRKAIPYVMEALRNRDPIIRYGGVNTLIRMTYLEEVQKILDLYSQETSIKVKLRYIELFSNIGINEPLVRDALIQTLKKNRDEKVRAEVATALQRFVGEESETALIESLSATQTEFVKMYIVKALGRREAKKPFQFLSHFWILSKSVSVPFSRSLFNP